MCQDSSFSRKALLTPKFGTFWHAEALHKEDGQDCTPSNKPMPFTIPDNSGIEIPNDSKNFTVVLRNTQT